MVRALRSARRLFAQNPGFAATAIVTLTLGIGSSIAIFAILDAVLLDPLPFPQPDRLVAIASQPDGVMSIPTMRDYLSRSSSFSSLAAYRSWSPAQKITDGAPAHRIMVVSQGFFSTLGTSFALGANWPITGNEQDCNQLAIVSAGYWRRIGGGSALGNRILNLDNRDFHIVGVLPANQELEGSYALNRPEVFLPIGCDTEERANERGDSAFEVIGRLRPHVTIVQAAADLARVDQSLQKDYPNYYGDYNAVFRRPPYVFPYLELVIGAQTRPALLAILAACGLLLAIACTNLANLLLARQTRRRTEFATRVALGATSARILQQLLAESLLFVGLGSACGIAFAFVLIRLVRTTAPFHLPRLAHASISPAVLAFAVLLSSAVALFLTLLPARRALAPGLLADLQGAARSSAGRSLRFAGRLLVVAQITFAMVLVACAGWMIGAVYLLLHQPLGFAPERLLMVEVALPPQPAGHDASVSDELRLSEIAHALRQLPGVAAASITDHPPLGHAINRYDFCSDVHPEQCKRQENQNPNSYAIAPGYFATIGQSLLSGRDFTAADNGENHVVIVNRALAAREWPGQSALGHRVHTGEINLPHGQSWATVIGVVGDVHNTDLESAPSPDIYIPRAEHPGGFVTIVVSAAGDPALLKNAVRAAIKANTPSARIFTLETFGEEMASEVVQRVFLMRMGMGFGAVALFLSILGTYGLLAYEVSLREKEIGIRLALGSTRQRIVSLLLREEGRWLIAGTLLGLLCASAAGYILRARFYGAHATSPIVLACAALALFAPALLAIALPARRASLLDPAQTLRRE